ncbi:MAG: S8 family serine peptidase [Gammaproteobacteria bacterium]
MDHAGHGTHVADILAGRSPDGTHVGVAPGATLLAVKVCSASVTSTACNGVAILKGLDFALDPNHDDVMDDAVDVINMSLGAPYGQKEDSTSVAASNAARAGIVVVAAAGNSSDKPYDLGSPGISPDVITVAQTQVPTAVAIRSSLPRRLRSRAPTSERLCWPGAKVTSEVKRPWCGSATHVPQTPTTGASRERSC